MTPVQILNSTDRSVTIHKNKPIGKFQTLDNGFWTQRGLSEKVTDGFATLTKPVISARHLGRLAVCLAIFPGKPILRSAYRLLKSRTAWNSNLKWSADSTADLKWQIDALHSWNGEVILHSHFHGQMETNASQTGWVHFTRAKKPQGCETFTLLQVLKLQRTVNCTAGSETFLPPVQKENN